jgi:hypothetical protein
MTAVASQPNVLLNRPLMCSPITLRSEPSRVISIRSGGATMPLITAVANSALIVPATRTSYARLVTGCLVQT